MGEVVISACGKYRYRLEREWEQGEGTCAFIMLNPSTADASEDDATIRRCIDYAQRWGYRRLVVGNLYALRSTDPKGLWRVLHPVGPDNEKHLVSIAREADYIVCAWGNPGQRESKGAAALKLLADHCADRSCVVVLKWTGAGEPIHPLYQKKDIKPLTAWPMESPDA